MGEIRTPFYDLMVADYDAAKVDNMIKRLLRALNDARNNESAKNVAARTLNQLVLLRKEKGNDTRSETCSNSG